MATTAKASQLTVAYRRESAALKAAVVHDVLHVWPLLNLDDVSTSWPALMVALKAIVESRREASVASAANYVRRFRDAEGVPGRLDVVRPPTLNAAATEASFRATGPATIIRALTNGLSPRAASTRALTTVSGAATRIALDGGRQTVVLTTDGDRHAFGWMRLIHGKTCAFCAMLASRGPVYKTQDTATFVQGGPNRFHDHCDCAAEPVYSRSAPWPEESIKARDLWAATTSGLSGKEAINAFRVAHEATL